jgi:hypothetical protein
MLNLYSFLVLLTLPGLAWIYYRPHACRTRLIGEPKRTSADCRGNAGASTASVADLSRLLTLSE